MTKTKMNKTKVVLIAILMFFATLLLSVVCVFAASNALIGGDVKVTYEPNITMVTGSNFKTAIQSAANGKAINKISFVYEDPSLTIEGDIMEDALGDDIDLIVSANGSNTSVDVYVSSPYDILANESCGSMFANLTSLTEIVFENFNTSNTTSMASMFSGCSALTSLDLCSFSTSKVTSFKTMFSGCSSLETIYVSDSWVITMTEDLNGNPTVPLSLNMFNGCTSLKGGIGTPHTAANVDANYARIDTFLKRGYLTDGIVLQTLKSYDDGFTSCLNGVTGEVVFDYYSACPAFRGKEADYNVDVNEEGTIKLFCVDNTTTGLKDCYILSENEIIAPEDCTGLFSSGSIYGAVFVVPVSITFNNFNTGNVTNMSYMFASSIRLTKLDLSSFNTGNVTNMSGMFGNCSSLTEIEFGTNFNTSKVTNMSSMFDRCTALTEIEFGTNFNTSNVTDMSYMFRACSGLKELDVSSFNTNKVTNMMGMFTFVYEDGSEIKYYDTLLTKITFGENFNTKNVTSMASMFSGCINLTSLDLSYFNTSKVTDMSSMFDCSRKNDLLGTIMYGNLTEITFGGNFNTENVTDMKAMFKGCWDLTSLNLSNFNTSKVTDMSEMFYGCGSLSSLNFGSTFTTSKVHYMTRMFMSCRILESLDLSNFDTSLVSGMAEMFSSCAKLTTIYVSDLWNINKVYDLFAGGTFNGCTSLVGGAGTICDGENNTDADYARIDGGTSNPGYLTYKAN